MTEKVVLIDTDAGLDDTLSIIMAIKAHQNPSIPFRIVGITCVKGNTKLDNVTTNVTKILEVMNASDIPIFRGANHAMVTPHAFPSEFRYHGHDGFGDVPESELKRPVPKLEEECAVSAIIRLANQFQGKLSIVALGPLTNLGLAIRADDRIGAKIKEIFLMGGSIEGRGNAVPTAEFNFYVDPEAAHVTLTSYPCPITIAPKELAESVVVQTRDWRINVLGEQGTPECHFFNLIERKMINGLMKEIGVFRPHDSTIMAALIQPSVVTKKLSKPLLVELIGQHTRGQLVIDHRTVVNDNKVEEDTMSNKIELIADMDVPLFQKMLIWSLNSEKFYKN